MSKQNKPSALLWKLAAGTALAVVMAGAASAQQAGPNAEVDSRDTVIVIGQTIEETLPQELKKYGSDVEEVSSEEVRDQGFVDVSQALQMEVPGLFLAPRGGPFSYLDISLQGSRTQDMLFLVDGVRINNRLYSGTITDTLPASMVERIEVLKGGQSLYYGTQAAAGVINIVTRGYTDEFDGSLSVGGDTNNSLHLDGYVRGAAGPGNYVLYASQDKSDGFDTYTTTQPSATDLTRSYDVNSIGGKYRFDLTDTIGLDARYQHTGARLDYPGAARVAYSKNERDEDIASVGLDWSAAEWAQFLVKGYWHDWDSNYTTINNTIQPGTGAITGQVVVDNETYWGYEDKGVNALGKFTPGGPFEYVVGYDFQQYSGLDEVLLIDEQEEEVHAFFAQLRTSDELFSNAAFAAGIRYNDTGGTTKTVWNASGRYDFTPILYVQGTLGTSFLLPTAEQLYAVDPFSTLGKPDLAAEESEGANLSLGGDFEGARGSAFSWQATYFARNIDNLIGFADFSDLAEFAALYPGLQVDPDPTTSENEYFINGYYNNVGGEVQVRGFELLGRAALNENWDFSASYTHTDSEQENASGNSNAIQRIPVDFAKAGAGYEATSGRWGADASLLWTGEQRANVTLNDGAMGNQSTSLNYGDYVVLDLAAHAYLDAGHVHKLTVRLENAFDENYVTRPSSTLVDGTLTGQRFVYGNRGVPQTLHVTYSYDF